MVEGDASVTARPPVPTRNAFSSELFQVWPVVYFVLFVSHLSRVIVHTHSHAREKLCWEYIEHGDANGCCTQAKKQKMGRKRLGVGAAEECVHNRYIDCWCAGQSHNILRTYACADLVSESSPQKHEKIAADPHRDVIFSDYSAACTSRASRAASKACT